MPRGRDGPLSVGSDGRLHAPELNIMTGASRGVKRPMLEPEGFTRLALQLFLVKVFTLYSFQLLNPKELSIGIYCHYLGVSPLDNLRACCLPWMW